MRFQIKCLLLVQHRGSIHDIREQSGLTLDTAGFEIVISPSNLQVKEFEDAQTIEDKYYPEIERFALIYCLWIILKANQNPQTGLSWQCSNSDLEQQDQTA